MNGLQQAQIEAGLWWNATAGWVLTHGLRIVAILIVGRLAASGSQSLISSVSNLVTTRVGESNMALDQRTRTIATLLYSTVRILIIFIVLLTVLKETGFDLTPILASAGVAGLAIGFGAQSLVKDAISGFFILMEGQFQIGDQVAIGSCLGVVEAMTLRTTSLRDADGVYHIIPNGSIQLVSVHTRGWARSTVAVDVSYGADLNQVFEVLRNLNDSLGPEIKDLLLEPPEILGVENLGAQGITVKLSAKVKPLRQAEVARLWRRRIKEELDKAGIPIPQTPPPVLPAK